jgi:hypothetical protein
VTTNVTATSIRAGQVLDLAGVAMRFWAADTARADAMAALLRDASPSSAPPSVEVRFDVAAAPPMQWSGDAPYEVRRERPDLVSVRSALGLVARVTPDQIVIVGDAPDLRAALRPVFAFAVAHVMAGRDRHVLHAATLSVEDGCVLVLGASGAGKSTVALCALRCGWPVFGDDLVALEVHGERVLATALPRPMAVPRDLVDDARAVPVPGDPRGRLELPTGTIAPGTRPVLGLIVTKHADSPRSTLREIRPFAVPPVVLTSSLVAESAEMRRTLFPLSVTLSRLPTVELAHGSDPGARLEDGMVLLEQIRTRFIDARPRSRRSSQRTS